MMNQKEFNNPSAYYDYKKFNENLAKTFTMIEIFYILN